MYYLYTPDMERESVSIYKTYEEASKASLEFDEHGYQAYICEYGYPFA